jgi:hypothetical protein
MLIQLFWVFRFVRRVKYETKRRFEKVRIELLNPMRAEVLVVIFPLFPVFVFTVCGYNILFGAFPRC